MRAVTGSSQHIWTETNVPGPEMTGIAPSTSIRSPGRIVAMTRPSSLVSARTVNGASPT